MVVGKKFQMALPGVLAIRFVFLRLTSWIVLALAFKNNDPGKLPEPEKNGWTPLGFASELRCY